ncbi:MAG: thiazole biosynthesis protein ThiF [Armatimonadetes bacterium]|jgi:molybdopterin/thiamine biosynthesis adenylyltransferase|nr:thiazole biosynthesis protein ThiF [Armatimonadota bacterium]
MDLQLEAAILTASQSRHIPGFGERRVLAPAAVKRLADAAERPAWDVEATALESEVVPLHYLRNLAELSMPGQIRLLRSCVALVGSGRPLERAVELLALQGVGRISLIVPALTEEEEPVALYEATRLARQVTNRNASCEVTTRSLRFRGGNPAEAVRGAQVVAACLPDAASEQLLQFACRMCRAPVILAGVEGNRGQAITVFPGDPGVALVYKPSHPHLSPDRTGAHVEARAALVAGTWLAGQSTAVLLESSDVLRGRLLYADLETGELAEYPL